MSETNFQAAVNYDHALWRAAAESDVDDSYWDIFGQQHHVSRDGLQAILRAIGWRVDTFEAIEEQRRQRFVDRANAICEVTAVVSENDKWVRLSWADEAKEISYQIELEDGRELRGAVDLRQLSKLGEAVLFDQRWSQYRLGLPDEIPLGYHALSFKAGGKLLGKCTLIVCPDRAYMPQDLAHDGRTAGFNVALYGLRSSRNWGCGDFSDLKVLIDWAVGDIGFSFVGLNPLHALHNRTPYNTSPYLPLSMYYKNLIYLDVESLPEFQNSAWAKSLFSSAEMQTRIQHLRDSPFVQYSDVASLKRTFLKVLYRELRRGGDSERTRRFAAYCEQEGDLLSKFALYSALDEELHKQNRNLWTWRDWPAGYQSPNSPESRSFAEGHKRSIGFYKYIQFAIEEQLAAAQRHALDRGMPIGLYHDLAVATDNFGSDLWAYPDHYVAGCRVGAPPDDFSPQGQDWGFPPPNRETHRAEGYQLYRESIRKIVRHGGALRIDHVMRLYRLFWVPQSMSPADGTYVRDHAADLMHVLALESVRSRNIIIGEDLGTVTDEMRALFSRFGILSYRLFPFEKNYKTGEFKGSFEYPCQALVSSSTHDLPTLAGFWEDRDIRSRLEAGMIDEGGFQSQLADRRREKQRMLDTLHSEDLLPPHYPRTADAIHYLDGDLHNAVVAFLARVPSRILLLNQEDFTKETNQQNLPGSTSEYPNWQRKMRLTVEELTGSLSAPYSEMFRYWLKLTGRGMASAKTILREGQPPTALDN